MLGAVFAGLALCIRIVFRTFICMSNEKLVSSLLIRTAKDCSLHQLTSAGTQELLRIIIVLCLYESRLLGDTRDLRLAE